MMHDSFFSSIHADGLGVGGCVDWTELWQNRGCQGGATVKLLLTGKRGVDGWVVMGEQKTETNKELLTAEGEAALGIAES